MPTANDVESALKEALEESKAESQPADQHSPEVSTALKAALGKGGAASDEDAEDKEAKEEAKGTNAVPMERFSKVVKQKNEALEQLKALEEKFKTASTRETQLTARLEALETDSKIVQAIRDLAQDQKYRSHVEIIDKALQGVETEAEAVKEAEEKGDGKALKAAEKRFLERSAQLEDIIADQHAESLLNEARSFATKVLARLPEEYTDEDRSVISKLWTQRVDWDYIEENGAEAIPGALNSSLALVIKEYGTPRGALVAKTTKEIEARVPEAKQVSPAERAKGILETNWAELKDGKPVHSDDEFAKNLGALLKATRQG